MTNEVQQCQSCGKSLYRRLKHPRCRQCREQEWAYRAARRRQAQLAQARRQRDQLLMAEFGTTYLKVHEYEGQELLPDGRYAILGRRPIPRRCANCHRDDRQVKGNWSPAYEDDQEQLILLCWTCYKNRIESESPDDE